MTNEYGPLPEGIAYPGHKHTFLYRMQQRAALAARILEAHGDHKTAALTRDHAGVNDHTWPGARPQVAPSDESIAPVARDSQHSATWRSTPPAASGSYLWRRGPFWEPIWRDIPPGRMVFSSRYEKLVPVEMLDGEWYY